MRFDYFCKNCHTGQLVQKCRLLNSWHLYIRVIHVLWIIFLRVLESYPPEGITYCMHKLLQAPVWLWEISWKAICSEQLKGVIYFPVDKALLGETCSPEVFEVNFELVRVLIIRYDYVRKGELAVTWRWKMKAPYEAKAPELEMKQSCLLITKHMLMNCPLREFLNSLLLAYKQARN